MNNGQLGALHRWCLLSLISLMPFLWSQDSLCISNASGVHKLEWESEASQTYFFERSINMQEWEWSGDYYVGDGLAQEHLLALTNSREFWRYVAYDTNLDNPDDTDADGVSNLDELTGYLDPVTGEVTSPFIEDTNADGIRDDGLVYAILTDPDGLGISDDLLSCMKARWDLETISDDGFYPDVHSGTYPAEKIGLLNESVSGLEESYSVSIWIRFTEGGIQNFSSFGRGIWAYDTNDDQFFDLGLIAAPAATVFDTQKLYLITTNAGFNDFKLNVNLPFGVYLDDGEWHHFVVSRASNEYRLYADGAELGTATAAPLNTSTLSGGGMIFGHLYRVLSPFGNDLNVRGQMDRLAVFSKDLVLEDVIELYEQDSDGDSLTDRYEVGTRYWNDENGDGEASLDELFYTSDPFRYNAPVNTETE